MKSFSFFFLLFVGFAVQAQTIQFLDKYRRPTADSAQAYFYTKTFKNPNSQQAVVRTYYLDGLKLAEEQYADLEKKLFTGTNKTWHENGQLKNEINYLNNTFHGFLKTYYANGQLRREENYEKGKLLAGICFTRTGSDTTYFAFQTLPQFPGGEKGINAYLLKNLNSPPKSNKAEGMVVAKFLVTPEGKASEITILKGLTPWHEKEVIRVISEMPAWKPGQQEGQNFSMSYILPVRFLVRQL